MQHISSEFIVLRPPEKLVIETRASGQYERIMWERNGVVYGEPGFAVNMPQEFPEFYEMFVKDPSSSDDFGVYSVTLMPVNGSQQKCTQTNITVIPYSRWRNLCTHIHPCFKQFNIHTYCSLKYTGQPLTHSTSGDEVTIISGESINISCISYGSPIPSIMWYNENAGSSFIQFDTVLEQLAFSPSIGEFNFSVGGTESILLIKDAQYPQHSGVYTCLGSNEHAGSSSSSSTSITVQVHGM